LQTASCRKGLCISCQVFMNTVGPNIGTIPDVFNDFHGNENVPESSIILKVSKEMFL
jgi:hypothetical protein